MPPVLWPSLLGLAPHRQPRPRSSSTCVNHRPHTEKDISLCLSVLPVLPRSPRRYTPSPPASPLGANNKPEKRTHLAQMDRSSGQTVYKQSTPLGNEETKVKKLFKSPQRKSDASAKLWYCEKHQAGANDFDSV